MTLGRRLAANQKTFHISKKIQKMAGISKYYRTKLLKKVLIKMFTFKGIITWDAITKHLEIEPFSL